MDGEYPLEREGSISLDIPYRLICRFERETLTLENLQEVYENLKPITHNGSVNRRLRETAKREVRKSRGRMDVEMIRLCAKEYKEMTERNRIVLENTDVDGKKKILFLKHTHMLSKEYCEKLHEKFKKLRKNGLGITITLRSDDLTSVNNDVKRIEKCFVKLLKRIKRRYKNADIEYFRVCEIGKENYTVHYHVIVYGVKYISQKWLSKVWKEITGDSYVVWVSRRNKKAIHYVRKYITKTLKSGEIDDGYLMIWACGLRVWSSSRGLFDDDISKNDDRHQKEVWVLLGLCINCDYEGVYEVRDYG